MRPVRLLYLAPMAMLAVATLPAHAADAPGRFSMTPTGDGFLKLDTATGAISLCRNDNEQWTCKAVADESQALADEIDRLAKENLTLRADNERLRGSAVASGSEQTVVPTLPSDADIDRTIGFIEKLMKKFKGLARELSKDEPIGTPL